MGGLLVIGLLVIGLASLAWRHFAPLMFENFPLLWGFRAQKLPTRLPRVTTAIRASIGKATVIMNIWP